MTQAARIGHSAHPREPVPAGFAGLPPAGPGPVRAAGAGLMCLSGWPAWKVARMAETALIRIVTQFPALQRLAACGGGGWLRVRFCSWRQPAAAARRAGWLTRHRR
jgi:hypothetical protein